MNINDLVAAKGLNHSHNRDEIEYIINKLNRIKSTDINNEETNLFKYNLMSLLSSESTEPWLRVPAINLFESGKKLFLN